MIIYENVSNAFINELTGLVNYGSHVQLKSNRWTRERLNIHFSIKNEYSINRIMNCIPGIDINIPFLLADFYDIMEGGNPGIAWYYHNYNLEFLEDFDNGLRYSYSYGDRFTDYLKNSYIPTPMLKTNQIKNTLARLANDHTSRRAVMVIWNPHIDSQPNTWNVPCNNLIQFLIRNNQLHVHLYIRSQDIFSGFNYDLTHFMLMQQIFAELLGCDVGLFNYTCGSFHYYDYAEELATKIHANQIEYVDNASTFIQNKKTRPIKFKECWRYIKQMIRSIASHNEIPHIDPLNFFFESESCFLYGVFRYFKAGHLIKQNRLEEAYSALYDADKGLFESIAEFSMFKLLARKAMRRGNFSIFQRIDEMVQKVYPYYYEYFMNYVKTKNGLGVKIKR